jgi:hypothetical protein
VWLLRHHSQAVAHPATIEKRFEALHTTKANGMGVGLTICRSIIESFKGRLWATPNDGPGATFSFSIRVAYQFNDERPHEALGMKTPSENYVPSPRPYVGLPDLTYPLHDRDALVTACRRICMHRKKISISYTLAGQRVGVKEVDDGIWIVSFMHYDLGYIDLEQKTLQPLDNPFGARLLPMS